MIYLIKYQVNPSSPVKLYRDRYSGEVKKFSRYTNALRIKNWFQDKGVENVRLVRVEE